MFKKRFAVLTLVAAAFTAAPIISSATPLAAQDNRDDAGHRNDRHDSQRNDNHNDQRNNGRNEQANRNDRRGGDYHFRSQDAPRLRQNYRNVDRVDRNHRAHYSRGEHLPNGWRQRIQPVPVTVVRELPPPPPGYRLGYLDGYAVAYNPTTQIIADVIDLATIAANSRR